MNTAEAPIYEHSGRVSPAGESSIPEPQVAGRVNWSRAKPFIGLQLSILSVFFVGWSWPAVCVALLTLWARTFALTAGYHRLFSHRAYKAKRWFMFALAWVGASAVQMGPLWWAAHHRHHHRYTDTESDIHSPSQRGFFWSHMGWVMSRKYYDKVNYAMVADFAKYPELRWIDRFYLVPAVVLVCLLGVVGIVLEAYYPHTGVTVAQVVVWGFIVSTFVQHHVTFSVNSFAHMFGTRRFNTKDTSKNNFWVALLTMGEGWHNNHHRCPSSERQGFYWWEIDMTHYLLKLFSLFGWVYDLRTPPAFLYKEALEMGRTS